MIDPNVFFNHPIRFRYCCLLAICLLLLPSIGYTQSGLEGYSNYGIVRNGVVYFHKRYAVPENVVAFDVKTFEKIRTYNFGQIYDVAPLVEQQQDGTWLIIEHEMDNKRTRAKELETGEDVWISEANQPNTCGMGLSYFIKDDGTMLILVPASNGLHALSIETGETVWYVARQGYGKKPAVDQTRGYVYFQSNGRLDKINAATGEVMNSVTDIQPKYAMPGNTILVDDAFGQYIATSWHPNNAATSALRIYDLRLQEVWSNRQLHRSKKGSMAYHEGVLYSPQGDGWNPVNGDWKHVKAFRINDGKELWDCDLSAFDYAAMTDVVYAGGYLYAITDGGVDSAMNRQLFKIEANTGRLVEALDYGHPGTTCGVPFISNGTLFEGNHFNAKVEPIRIGAGTPTDWAGSYGDPQMNHAAAPEDAVIVPSGMKYLDYGHQHALELRSLAAIPLSMEKVQVRWETLAEEGLLGYQVYRGTNDNFEEAQLLTPDLIPAHNLSAEGAYFCNDKGNLDSDNRFYWLESIEQAPKDDITSTVYGPVRLAALPLADLTPVDKIPATSTFHLYPNPAKDLLMLQFPTRAVGQPFTIQIIDAQGSLKYAAQAFQPQLELDISHLSNGMYILLLNGPNGVVVRERFVVGQ